mgnify:CR=1 FL=1
MVSRLLALILLVFLPLSVLAHPGRLNEDGCHHVRKDFTYKSGKVVRKGEYHCHRLLVGKPAVLDGSEVLGDKGDDQREDDGRDQEDQSP